MSPRPGLMLLGVIAADMALGERRARFVVTAR
jgi:hypothetical protein